MHEDRRNESCLEGRDQECHRNIRLLRPEINVGKSNGYDSESNKNKTNNEIAPHMFCDIVCAMLIVRGRFCGRSAGHHFMRLVHCLKQIKKWENKNPDQIYKMPE